VAVVFERFTDRAGRVLALAQNEAGLLGHNFIGTEHILFGLLHEEEGVAVKALESLGISLAMVRAKVEEIVAPGQSATSGSPPFTPRAKKVLELSLREALQLGHNYIGPEHMLLGLVREGEGVAAQVLRDLGAEPSRVRDQVVQLLSAKEWAETPPDSVLVRRSPAGVWPRDESSDPPRCPWCRAGLGEEGVHRRLELPGAGDEGRLPFTVVYCRRCGSPSASFPADATLRPEYMAAGIRLLCTRERWWGPGSLGR